MSDCAVIAAIERKAGCSVRCRMEADVCVALDLTSDAFLYHGLIRHHSPDEKQDILRLICELRGLRELNLRRNRLGGLPAELKQLQQLEVLNLGSNALNEIPSALRALRRLRYLHLGNNNLFELPEWFGELDQIEHLLLHKNLKLRALGPIAPLRRLKGLNLFFLNLHELPGFIYGFEELVTLTLWNVSRFSEDLANLQDLQYFSICGTPALKELPPAFTRLKRLRMTRLFQNSLERLPEDFGSLEQLEQVSLYQNRLRTLPASFAQLRRLKKLNLGWNCFTEFPECLVGCTQLEWLGMFANPVVDSTAGVPFLPRTEVVIEWPFTTLKEACIA